MKANFKSILALVLIVVLTILAVSFFSKSADTSKPLVYSEVIEMFNDDRVTSFVVDGNLKMTMKAVDIAEDGTYDELIARGGKFAQLVERQRLDT